LDVIVSDMIDTSNGLESFFKNHINLKKHTLNKWFLKSSLHIVTVLFKTRNLAEMLLLSSFPFFFFKSVTVKASSLLIFWSSANYTYRQRTLNR